MLFCTRNSSYPVYLSVDLEVGGLHVLQIVDFRHLMLF